MSPKDYTHHSISIRGSYCSHPYKMMHQSVNHKACTTLKASGRSFGHRDCHKMHPHKPTSRSKQTKHISAITETFNVINITQNVQQLGISPTHCYNKLEHGSSSIPHTTYSTHETKTKRRKKPPNSPPATGMNYKDHLAMHT